MFSNDKPKLTDNFKSPNNVEITTIPGDKEERGNKLIIK